MFATNFTTLDWVIVAVYLTGTGIIGMVVNRHIHNSADYLVGGRSSGTALSVASFIGTGLGLVTLMYASIDAFNRGFSYLFIPLLGMAAPMVLGATGLVMARLREMRLTTIPEFFGRRYDRRVRVTAGIICTLAGILNMGLFPKMGAIFITYATGLGAEGDEATIVVNVITSLLIVLVLAYTVLGGMVAVLVTDYLQFVVLSVGMGIGLWYCFTDPALGWDNMVSTFAEHKGAAAFNPVDPGSYGWLFLIWQVFVVTTAAICWAPEATRALTTRDPQTTNRTFLLGSPGFFARMAIPAVWGIAAFCFVANHPDLKEYFSAEQLKLHGERGAQAMPLLIGKLLPTGLLGLLVAGLMAAFMSTHDSYLLAWSSVISEDIIGPFRRGGRSTDRESIRVTRISVVVIGVFLLVWGIWYELPDSVWTYMSVTGTIYLSGAAPALVGGMYWKGASSTGAMWSLLGGLIAVVALAIEPIQVRLGPGSEVWFNAQTVGLAVFVLCAALFFFGSLLFPDDPQRRDSMKGLPA